MNTYFQKLNFSIDSSTINFPSLKGDFNYAYNNPDGSLLNYRYIHKDGIPLVQQVFSNFIKIAPNNIRFVEVKQGGYELLPHRDYGVPCTINYYFRTNDATTYWYKKGENSAVEHISRKYQTIIYVRDELELCDQFTARNNDCYLLNTDEIHSMSGGTDIRQFIQIQYTTPYHEIVRLLNLERATGFEPATNSLEG